MAAIGAGVKQDPGDYYEAMELQLEPPRPEYLMIGLEGEHGLDRLLQIDLTEAPATDAAFFRLLRTECSKNRRRYYGFRPFWKKVRRIHFIQFWTQAAIPSQQTIQVQDFNSVPEPLHLGWVAGSERPPNPDTMAACFNYPECAGEGRELYFYPQVPRLDTKILARPDEKGWGLYIVEDTRWTLFRIMVFTFWVLSYASAVALLLSVRQRVAR